MKRKFLTWVLTMGLLFGSYPLAALDSDEDLDYSYGKVAKVSAGKIILKEIDPEGEEEEEIEVSYTINPETVLANIGSLEEIAIGDEIEIFFRIEKGQKTAVQIAKYADMGGEYQWDDDESNVEEEDLETEDSYRT